MDLSGVKKTDIGVAAYLLAAIIFFIVPIPSILLDVMLALNISVALIVLMMSCLCGKFWICPFSRPCFCLRRSFVFP